MTSPTPRLAIETRGLGKRFGARAAVVGVDLEVPRGVAFGFLGANGAGKTTLIRLLLGLARPTSGSMRLLARELPGGSAEALARVGAIIEEPRFHPTSAAARTCTSTRRRATAPPTTGSTARSSASASRRAPTRRSRPTRWACASASASRAACSPTPSC